MVQIDGFTGNLGTGSKQGTGAQLAGIYKELTQRLGGDDVVRVVKAFTPAKEKGENMYKETPEEPPKKGPVMPGKGVVV